MGSILAVRINGENRIGSPDVGRHFAGKSAWWFTRYTELTSMFADFSGIRFMRLRLLRKTPFLTTGVLRKNPCAALQTTEMVGS